MESFKEIMSQRLLESAERLVKLINLRAPETIIGKEVAMLVEASAGYCGPVSAYHHLQDSAYQRLVVQNGFCYVCDADEPRRATSKLGFCDICATRLSRNDT